MSIESVIPSNHLILCHPLLLLPPIFPSIRVFSSELSAYCMPWVPQGLSSKESACNARDMGLICGSESSPGEGNGNSFPFSCLEIPKTKGLWQATVHGITTESDTTEYMVFLCIVCHAPLNSWALNDEQAEVHSCCNVTNEWPTSSAVATHSSVLAWRIPGMGEPGGLPSMGSHRVRHD